MNNDTTDNTVLNAGYPEHGNQFQEGLVQIFLRHRWAILTSVLLFLGAAFIYLLKATPVYTSTSRLYVEQSGPKIINEYEGIMTRSNNYLYTQIELIGSTPIIAHVADNPEIARCKTFDGIDNTVAFIKKNLNVSIGKKDDIIMVSIDSPYAVEAAQITNAVVDSYVNYHSSHKRSTVSEVLRILQKEKLKRDAELTEKFMRLVEFTRENGIVPIDGKNGHISFQRLGTLSSSLTEAQLASINAQADFKAIESMIDEPAKIKQFAMALPSAGVRVFVNDVESQLFSELKDLEIQLKNIQLHCTETHPSTQAIRARIVHITQMLNDQAKKFADAYLEVTRLRLTTARQREGELLASFENQWQEAQDMSVKTAEYAVVQSELKRTERLCDILDDRIKELNVT